MKKEVRIVSESHPIVQKKIERTLDLSIKEGSYASIATGLDVSYFSPYALAMNATSGQVGFLHAVLNIIPSITQMFSPGIISKFSRKKTVLFILMINLLLLIPIMGCGFLYFKGYNFAIWILIGLVGLFYGLMSIAQPAWFSWMGSLVPEQRRGSYFSIRTRISGFFGLLSMIFGALILDLSRNLGVDSLSILAFTLIGFGIIFFLAIIFRLLSWSLLSMHYEPKIKFRKRDSFSFWSFLKNAPKNPFGRFVIFRGFFGIAIGISAPFWAVYMLRDLGFSYFWFMAITVSGTIFQLIFLPLLGKFSDRYGNIKLTAICSGMAFLIPLLWIFSSFFDNDSTLKIYLLFVPSIFSGFVWAGYNLATSNYVYDSVSSNKRSFGVSYMNLIVGVGTFVGASIGSFVALYDFSFINTILFIFLLSSFARLFVFIFGAKYLKEVRSVKKFNPHFFVREFRPMQGMVREFHHAGNLVRKIEHYV